MSDQQTLDATASAELIITVDDGRESGDAFKLSTGLRAVIESRLAAAQGADSSVTLSESGRGRASGDLRVALDALEVLVRDGYKFIAGLASYDITPVERHAAFVAYGWDKDELGNFPDSRIVELADKAATSTPQIATAAHRYPAALLTRIEAQRAIVTTLTPKATTSDRAGAVDDRNDDRDLLEKAIARARFFYCQASDDTDQTPELSRIGMQPRRDRGTVQHAKPDTTTGTPGTNNPA